MSKRIIISSLLISLFATILCIGGVIQRVPNNTLFLPAAGPIPLYGYTLTNAFGNLGFSDPVGIVTPPGETNRLFIVERTGNIAVITNLASPNRTIFLSISNKVSYTGEGGLLGIAFHPGYATNGYFYLYYYGPDITTASGAHDILARYQVSAGNSNSASAATELKLIRQFDEADNHNAGDLKFGADGYLYLALGDEGGGNDQYNNSQRIDKDFFSGLIRIDVDKRPGNLAPNAHPAATANYSIPADNPFVGATSFNGSAVNSNNVRTEFWAVGLRNPWRFTFDPLTGELYVGDVGQNAQEEIDLITKGGNYGWAFREGMITGPKTQPAGATAINPILSYGRGSATNQGACVVGGVVYRGSNLPQLTGAYVFGDYVNGNIWYLRHNGTVATEWQRIAGLVNVSTFGTDPRNGDILLATSGSGSRVLSRLVYSTNIVGQAPFPQTLAAAGVFTNLSTLTPHAGIVPYQPNVSFWSDNASKFRWFSIPDTNLTIGFNPAGNWTFPAGTVWVKHFELQLTNGVPASNRRLETRLLVKNSDGIYGVTYRWGNSTTNATLVAPEGFDEPLVIDEGGGVVKTQVWHYPSRQECLICHTPAGGYALGFNSAQLNRDMTYLVSPGITVTNQIQALSDAGYFNTNVNDLRSLRSLATSGDSAHSLEYRVRSYLAANCVQCHQPGGSAQGLWDARLMTATSQAGIINGPLINNGGDPNNRVVKPGSLANSMMLTRISNLGAGHMPPLGSSVVNTQAVALLSAWITNALSSYQSYGDWQVTHFGSTNGPNVDPYEDYDLDMAVNYLEYLTGTNPKETNSNWKINLTRLSGTNNISFTQIANRGFEVQTKEGFSGTNEWQRLNVPGNEPTFPITNRPVIVRDSTSSTNRFYRVRVFEP